jgi:hypothetical protein
VKYWVRRRINEGEREGDEREGHEEKRQRRTGRRKNIKYLKL